ncbi:MAG: carboxypeptidase regulatory-like domain-containing protein [Verrucomicrobiota bacterium]
MIVPMNLAQLNTVVASVAFVVLIACSKEEKKAEPNLSVPPAELKTNSGAGLSGRIILKGTPPPERDVAMDSSCGTFHKTTPKTRLYVVGQDGALADVFVYIKEGLNGKTFAAPTQPVLLDQVGCEYTPYIVGLQTGQKLLVRNSDPVMHNVHPTPTVEGNKEENKAQMAKSPDLTFVYNNPEQFLKFSCQVHPWMVAYVCVVPHPFFAMSAKEGTFNIKNVPPGKYVIEAVHRKLGKQTKEITIAEGEAKSLDFNFEFPGAK